MSSLSDLPLWLLLVMSIAALGGVVGLTRALGHRWFADTLPSLGTVAAPLMPALGAVFGVLAAFSVATAASDLREAEADVAREATAAARLAWATSGEGAEGAGVRADLQRYLEATTEDEWHDLAATSPGDSAASDEVAVLERSVRQLVLHEDLSNARQSELLGAIDDVVGARRARFATATPVEAGVFLLLVVSAVALLVNATVLGFDRARRVSALLVTLVAVTGASIALVLSLAAPFSGAFRASARPLTDVITDLSAGTFELEP